jgi:NAD(P)-dependent dehydrogenase (short-subunit alcohol dehydrogenase family)
MKIDLSNKIAVITGGTAGLGLSIAESFAGAGAQIAICSRNETNVDNALNFLNAKNIFLILGKTHTGANQGNVKVNPKREDPRVSSK